MNGFRLLIDLATISGAAIVMGLLFHRLKQPVVVGYLIGGLLVGPYGFKFISDVPTIEGFAEIGIVLLMFTLGFELSLAELKPVWKIAVWGTLLQLLATTALVVGVGSLLGLPYERGLLLGFIVAISSTMIVLKVLMERGEVDSTHGRICIGMLIVQDISVVPIMAILPTLAQPATFWGLPLLSALAKAIALLLMLGWLGTRFFPSLIGLFAATRNKELFLLAIIAICFSTAAMTYFSGLSLALGAFLAGLVAAKSDLGRQILAQIMPLRDLFATLFFVSTGMLIDPTLLLGGLGSVMLLLLGIMVGKAVITFLLVRFFGFALRPALLVSIGLAQIGEFSFVLARMGQQQGILTAEQFSLVLAAALLSILMMPILLQLATFLDSLANRLQRPPYLSDFRSRLPWLSPLLARWEKRIKAKTAVSSGYPLETRNRCTPPGHVVICGFGRVGRNLGEVLTHHKIPLLVVEIDPSVVQELQTLGIPYIFGDAGQLAVLNHAKLECARLLIVALPDPISTRLVLEQASYLNDNLPILCRAHRTSDVEEFYQCGADQVIQPEFEASLEAIRYTLAAVGNEPKEIENYVNGIRIAHYRQFLDDFKPEEVAEGCKNASCKSSDSQSF
ncbi:MAG: cation:proton antiporter [Cyanobacteria bacterium NC_groundwater_1444_Ag_S-0.65um_54_12]|nr:cation:proton antiporter [Cyanobacteria bacterium NC_groundwater_1444_Ag_S-0.65um_54_12]